VIFFQAPIYPHREYLNDIERHSIFPFKRVAVGFAPYPPLPVNLQESKNSKMTPAMPFLANAVYIVN